MAKSTKITVTRAQAFNSWIAGSYHIGQDVGSGVTLFIPQGLLGPLHQERLMLPARLLAKWAVGPLLGAVFVLIGLLPALYQGLYFKRLMKEQSPDWTKTLVKEHSVKTVWGALSISAIWLFAIMSGMFVLPPITLPALWIIPSITLGAVSSAMLLPITAALGVALVVGLGYGVTHLMSDLFQFSWSKPKKTTWNNALQGTVNANCDNPQIKKKLNKEIEFELQSTACAYKEMQQALGRDPTLKELKNKNVLSYYQLQEEQRRFVKSLNDAKKYATHDDKLNAVKDRRKQFA